MRCYDGVTRRLAYTAAEVMRVTSAAQRYIAPGVMSIRLRAARRELRRHATVLRAGITAVRVPTE